MSDYSNENFPKETTPPANTAVPESVLTEKMVFYLQGAVPWLRFVSIAGFVSLGISLISILIMAGSDSLDELGLGSGSSSALVFITLLPFLVIGFFCLFFTLQFGNKIKMYLLTKNQADLEDAFKNNKSLWTLSGIVLIISLAFLALAIIIGIVTVASTAAALL
jgi:hypothetical protein